MTETEVVKSVIEHLEGLFPKVCRNCNRRYDTLREYICVTTNIGPPISYDAECGNWTPTKPIGALVFANCPCGSTLTLGSEGMAHAQTLALLEWMKAETQRRCVSASELMEHLRVLVREQVRGAAADGAGAA